MTLFCWSEALMLVAFLGAEANRQRRGGALPMRQRVMQRMRGVFLLFWPFVFAVRAGDRLSGVQQFAVAAIPFVVLFLFCLHMAGRAWWLDHFDHRARERADAEHEEAEREWVQWLDRMSPTFDRWERQEWDTVAPVTLRGSRDDR